MGRTIVGLRRSISRMTKLFYSRFYSLRCWIKRKKLKNTDFSLISSNCNGALILHDLKQRFNSPFVNLWIYPEDYLRLLENFEDYMKADITFVEEEDITYPVGLLKDVKVFFQHYKTKEEAVEKWNTRKLRINYDNLFVMFTERDGCTYEDLQRFDRINIKNKIVFTHLEYKDIKSSVYIKGFENKGEVGHLFKFMDRNETQKYYDQFDYVRWFNTGDIN